MALPANGDKPRDVKQEFSNLAVAVVNVVRPSLRLPWAHFGARLAQRMVQLEPMRQSGVQAFAGGLALRDAGDGAAGFSHGL